MRSIALGFWIGAGSRYEEPAQAGVSHFIEHLIFKGTEHYSAWDIARIFDEMGGELNAATSKEYTVVHARFLDEQLDQAFSVMADMVQRPLFADIDSEREVVLEEVAMYEDSPADLIHDVLAQAVFDGHALARAVIGNAEALRRDDKQAVEAYHEAHYVKPAIVIAAVGNVDHARLCELAERHLGAGGAVKAPPAPRLATPVVHHVARFTAKETEQYNVCFGGLGPARDDPRRFALSVVDAALGGSSSSRLFQEVREKRGLAYSIYSYSSLYAETGMVAVYVGSRKEALEEALGIIRDELDRSITDLPEQEVERAKAHLKGQLVLGMESPHARMHQLGRSVLTSVEILSLDEMLAKVEAVTLEQAQALAREFYDLSTWSAVCIGPDPEPFRSATEGFAREDA